MKITVERNKLLAALGHVQSIVERKSSIPVLSNVRIEATGGKITLTTTDMDIASIESIDAQIEKGGVATVPAHMLYDICRKLKEEHIHLEEQGSKGAVDLRVDSGEFSLPTLPADEFPNFDIGEDANPFKVSSAGLTSLLLKTKHAMSLDETRYYLNGIYLHIVQNDEGHYLRAVSTDGHRLAQTQIKAPQGLEQVEPVIIPRKAVSEIIKLFEDKDSDISLILAGNKIVLQSGATKLISKLIDGKFPDYQRVIPQGNQIEMLVDPKELARAIDLVTSVSFEKTKLVRLDLSGNKLTISVSSEMQGNAKGSQRLGIDYNDQDFAIGFNSKYMLEALSVIEGAKVKFKFGSSAGATLLEDTTSSNAIQVMMPMQI